MPSVYPFVLSARVASVCVSVGAQHIKLTVLFCSFNFIFLFSLWCGRVIDDLCAMRTTDKVMNTEVTGQQSIHHFILLLECLNVLIYLHKPCTEREWKWKRQWQQIKIFDSTNDEHPFLFNSHYHPLMISILTAREVDFYLLLAISFDECHMITEKKQTNVSNANQHSMMIRTNEIAKWTKIKALYS